MEISWCQKHSEDFIREFSRMSNVLQRNTFLSHSVVLELASGASESCYLTIQEFRVIVLNISFDFNEEGLLVKFVFCNNVLLHGRHRPQFLVDTNVKGIQI